MKIQKGVLADPPEAKPEPPKPERRPAPTAAVVEKDRLFETLDKGRSGNRNYAKLFLIAVVIVLIAGGVIFYMTLPGVGDKVRAPKGLQQAVRDHLLDKQKRVATDITFYYCGGDSYWAESGVEKRSDIPNPVYKLDTYTVNAKGKDPSWEITSKPVKSPEENKPCT
ncbi:MAG: hypothetical protein ACJ73D_00955 [Pyrinomonadaceae bacterium]